MDKHLSSLEKRLQDASSTFVSSKVGSDLEKMSCVNMLLLQELITDYKRHLRAQESIT